MGRQIYWSLRIELEPGSVPKRSKVRPLNPDESVNLQEQLDPTRDHQASKQSLGIASSSQKEGLDGNRPEAT